MGIDCEVAAGMEDYDNLKRSEYMEFVKEILVFKKNFDK